MSTQSVTDPGGTSIELPPLGDDPIGDLEALLAVEHQYLSRLDVDGIEAVAQRKAELLPALEHLSTSEQDKARLIRVRELVIRNQLLTVHARETVGNIVHAAARGAASGRRRMRISPALVSITISRS